MATSYGYKQPSYGYMRPGQAGPSKGTRRLAASLAPQSRQANAAPSSQIFPSLNSGSGEFNPAPSYQPLSPSPSADGGEFNPAPAAPAAPGVAPLAPAAAPSVDPVSAALGQVAQGGTYDYTTDPVLQQIQQLGTRSRADAASGALKLRKQLAIQYGDANYAQNVLGDSATARAAEENPFAIPRQLKTAYDQGLRTLEDSYNKGNLWWSGTRATGLQDAANQYQGLLSDVTGQQQSALDQIAQQLLMANTAADERDQQAAQEAYARRLALALAAQSGAPPVETPSGGAEPPPYNPPPTGPPPDTTPPTAPWTPKGVDPFAPPVLVGQAPQVNPLGPGASYVNAAPTLIGRAPAANPLGSGASYSNAAPTFSGLAAAINPLGSGASYAPAKKKPASSIDLARLLGSFRG